MALRKLRVLVIDDSALNRRGLVELLSADDELEIIGTAADGEEGLKLALSQKPDAIALDLHMPRVDGFTFLRLLMAKRPTPVVVVSSQARQSDAFRALELGAVEFIARPTRPLEAGDPALAELRAKLKAMRHVGSSALRVGKAAAEEPITGRRTMRLAVIGASTGGPPALTQVLSRLPADLPLAVLIAQHMPESFTKAFAERLNRACSFEVAEASEGQELRPGLALIAPGGHDMAVSRTLRGLAIQVLPPDASVRYRPSVDILFQSVATHAPGLAIGLCGVVLTGMGSDGREGVVALHKAGALTIAESQESAVIFGMPKEAIDTGRVNRVLPLEAIGDALVRFGQEGR